jgi:hypothetical protein
MSKNVLNGMFGLTGMLLKPFGSDKPAEAPAAPGIMPMADDAQVQAARKKSIAAQLQRSGRSSTMLSNDSETLGG